MTIAIKSPKATQVKSTTTEMTLQVNQGDVLFELYDFEEEKILSELDRAIAENQACRAEVEGDFVKEKLRIMEDIVSQRGVALDAAQVALNGVVEEAKAGQRTELDVRTARNDVVLKTFQILQDSVAREIYARNVDDSASVFDHVDLVLSKEKEYVERARSRLRISAPRSGTFKRFVSAGTPVRRGHLLGEIS